MNTTLHFSAALETVLTFHVVDPARLGAVGYCFGGTGMVNLALAGHAGVNNLPLPAGLSGVVSFHGGIQPTSRLQIMNSTTRPKLLLESGGKDETHEDIGRLLDELESGGVNYEISRYGPGVCPCTSACVSLPPPAFDSLQYQDKRPRAACSARGPLPSDPYAPCHPQASVVCFSCFYGLPLMCPLKAPCPTQGLRDQYPWSSDGDCMCYTITHPAACQLVHGMGWVKTEMSGKESPLQLPAPLGRFFGPAAERAPLLEPPPPFKEGLLGQCSKSTFFKSFPMKGTHMLYLDCQHDPVRLTEHL